MYSGTKFSSEPENIPARDLSAPFLHAFARPEDETPFRLAALERKLARIELILAVSGVVNFLFFMVYVYSLVTR